VPRLGDLELLRAEHLTQSFPRHTHERYAVGVIERGALGFFYRGENVVASRGHINLCIPGEVHTGQPAGPEGWSYRMFYFGAHVLAQIASEVADRPRELPFFGSGVVTDAPLARRLREVHLQLEGPNTSRLEQETLVLNVLAQLIYRHADSSPAVSQAGREPKAVQQVRRYLENHYAEDVSLGTLAQLTQLSRYHLVHVFRQRVGIPPHAYLRQVRVARAKELLAAGQPIAEVALATGFTDQSHLHRWFKRLWGVSPGHYRNGVQDSGV
jgi:AraC-like DNA-binding protein